MTRYLLPLALLILLALFAAVGQVTGTSPLASGEAKGEVGMPGKRPPAVWVSIPPRPSATPSRASRSQERHSRPNWRALAECESSNNPRAVSSSGKYRGLYQMDRDFWRTYGGLHYAPRPDLATRSQQTAVALAGYAARGGAPWPFCKKFL